MVDWKALEPSKVAAVVLAIIVLILSHSLAYNMGVVSGLRTAISTFDTEVQIHQNPLVPFNTTFTPTPVGQYNYVVDTPVPSGMGIVTPEPSSGNTPIGQGGAGPS